MRSVLLHSHRAHSELSIRLKFVWFYQLTAAAAIPHSVQVIWIKLVFRCVDISTGETTTKKTHARTHALTLHWTIIVIIGRERGRKKNEMTVRRNKNNGSLTPYIFQLISPRKKKKKQSTATNFNVVFIWFYRTNEPKNKTYQTELSHTIKAIKHNESS